MTEGRHHHNELAMPIHSNEYPTIYSMIVYDVFMEINGKAKQNEESTMKEDWEDELEIGDWVE